MERQLSASEVLLTCIKEKQLRLHSAISARKMETIIPLVEVLSLTFVKSYTDSGYTALHYVVMNRNEKLIAYLLDKGENINARESNGGTPLHAAMSYGRIDNIIFLCENLANYKLLNYRKISALKLLKLMRILKKMINP